MHTRVLSRIKIDATAPWLGPLMNFIDALQPGGAVSRRVLKLVLIYGVLRSIRTTYLARLHTTMAMSVVSSTRSERTRENMSAGKRIQTLRKAYEALDDAVASGNSSRVQKAQRRVNAVDRSIAQRNQTNGAPMSRNEVRAMSLNALTSALMRDRSLQILDLLTNPTHIGEATMVGGNMTLGAGRLDLLERIKTPSATEKLIDQPTESQYDVLWKHLEFGTGMLASKNAPIDTTVGSGSHKNADGSWWYGGREAGTDKSFGMLVRGSSPMHAIWGASGLADVRHHGAAQQALERVMQELAPRFT